MIKRLYRNHEELRELFSDLRKISKDSGISVGTLWNLYLSGYTIEKRKHLETKKYSLKRIQELFKKEMRSE